jgi:hypothetical protein
MPQPLLNTSIVLAGLPDLACTATLTAGSSALDQHGNPLGPQNLKSAALSQVWRSLRTSPSSSWIAGVLAAGAWHAVGAVALCAHNLGGFVQFYDGAPNPTGTWRFRSLGWGGSRGAAIVARVTPLAILASSGLAGTVSAVQQADPEHPAASFLSATSPGGNTSARFSFASPTNMNLDATTNNQVFRIRLGSSGSSGAPPTITVTLYESGVSRDTIQGPLSPVGNFTGGGTGGNLFTISWNASALSGAVDDGRVQVQIDGVGNGVDRSVEIIAVEWVREFATGGSYTYSDSGVMPVVLPVSYPQYASPLIESYFPTILNLDSFWIDLADSANPNTYFQIGRLIVSAATTFEVGVDYNWGINWVDPSQIQRSQGSNVYAYRKNKWREFQGVLQGLTPTEAQQVILDQLDRQKGTWGDLLAVVLPDVSAFRYMRTLYCRVLSMTSQSQDSQVVNWGPDLYSRKLVLEELL